MPVLPPTWVEQCELWAVRGSVLPKSNFKQRIPSKGKENFILQDSSSPWALPWYWQAGWNTASRILAWFLRKQGLCKHTGVCASVCMYVSFLDTLHLQKLLSSLADFKPTLLKLLKVQYSYKSPENRWSHKGCAVHSASDRKANRTTLSRLQEIQDIGYCTSLFPQIMNLIVVPWSITQQTVD